ncbi:MAG TPA: hypothetical protein VGV90_08420 [Solirubrobacteraceae bacterium]|nr:hypothetical protein [Solirubrobacteraceae bacterium]
MSRLGRRRSLTLAATALVALTAPAAAHAATYTVKPGDGPCGGGDAACGGLVEAAAIAAAGDVFNVVAGTYPSATFNTDVTINGVAGFVVDGTLEFAGGGVSKLSKVAVVTGAGNAPAVYVSGGGGLELSDAVVVSRDGFGIFITSGAGNKIVRTGVATGGQATGAIQVQTGPDDADVDVTVESSVVTGGGAGIRAFTRNNEAEALAGRRAGDITLTLRHITAAGSTNGIDIDSSNSRTLLGNTGNISATVTDSIAFNNRVVSFPGTLGIPPLGANSATLARTRTLESGDPAALFVNPTGGNFHLRPDASAAIDQGGLTPGESATDIDGQDRSTAPTDLGADEYYPGPPPAAPTPAGPQNDGTPPAIAVTKPRANQKIKKTTRKTRTVTVNGKRVRRTTTTKLKRLAIAGTAKDPSGVKGVIVTIQKLGTAPGAKCKWFNATKGLVLKSCTKPVLLLARLAANGTWTYNANARKLSAGKYRIIVFGADNSGAAGNSASRGDAIRRFTLTNK